VAYGWQQETVAESARSVSKLGRELYDRLGVFAGHLSGVGKSLESAVRNYNSAVGSFETRVLVSARRFPDLGSGGEELPEVPPVSTQPRAVLAAALADGDAAAAAGIAAEAALSSTELASVDIAAVEIAADDAAAVDLPLELPLAADAA
jgi:DNA recombination protein RmuC